jgi:uncharacterized membrane protein YbhN (UPF0104 family)
LTSKTKKALSIFLKIAIVLLAGIFIYGKLNNNRNIQNFKALIASVPIAKVYLTLASVGILMFINWFLEAMKWQFLVSKIEQISMWKAVESVFCGLTWAVFTPNRIGEYGGRVMFLSPRKRIPGVAAMGVGAVSQMMLTNVLGAAALLWFIGKYVPLSFWLHYALFFLACVFCVFFIAFYFNIKVVNTVLQSISWLKPLHRFFVIFSRYKRPDLSEIFLYSLARFIVFTSQYYLVIHMLIPSIPAVEIIMMTFILFFVQSALPSLDLFDIGVRSMTATYFFGYVTNQDVAIMAATTSIWLINLIIPAILGAVFVFKLNFFDSNRN